MKSWIRTSWLAVFTSAVLGGWSAAPPHAGAAEQAAAPQSAQIFSFTIRADWFDRGNVRVSLPGEAYADRFACIWNAGIVPNQVEYDIDFPVSADYTLVALYAANDSRPVDILLDGEKIHQGFAGVTGSWQTSSARWETQCTVHITQGRHTVQLICPGPCMGHLCALRFETSTPFPEDWELVRPVAQAKRRAQPAPSARALWIPAIAGNVGRDAVIERIDWTGPAVDSVLGPIMHNELIDREDPRAGQDQPRRALVTIRSATGQTSQAEIEFSAESLARMTEQAAELIHDFRSMPGARPDLLAGELAELAAWKARIAPWLAPSEHPDRWHQLAAAYVSVSLLARHVALSNPLLDFERLLLVKRRLAPGDHGYGGDPYGLPFNWQSNCSIRGDVWDNEIAVLDVRSGDGELVTLYRPTGNRFVGDVDLHFDADRMLFSSLADDGHWQVFEVQVNGSGLRQVTPDLGDVHHYDACYLPDDGIIFSSTASMAAVPCVNGSSLVANLYRMDSRGDNIRQLCFDQEHNWCPTVTPDGRVMYLRWEYTDTPHAHDRLLFLMRPDGTGQMEFYGANSYWPNSLFYARPIPGFPTRFVGIVGGHHGVRRKGELVLFDVARGRHEAEGAIQRIPGRGLPVEPLIEDNLVDNSWPKFLHPYPLSDKYFLVAAKPTAQDTWGIYLADVFDNLVLLARSPGHSLLEPIPLRPAPRPPVIPDQVDLRRDDAVVYLSDVYAGDAMRGIPRGTVRQLRLISYHYLYPHMGGPQGVVGMEGPWDIKRILGTVPVRDDGSALFRVPANTPISVQPLDAEGKALQLMRSWFTAMPGEAVSCAGCHEDRNASPPFEFTPIGQRVVDEITPWYGPARGFNFDREVQPVLNRYCVGCHDGRVDDAGRQIMDLRGEDWLTDYTSAYHYGGDDAGRFTTSYAALHRFVRRPGLESDYHVLMPMEFHADTTELVQMLARGHHNVQLDSEAWDRLITWIDLNAPFHGTWTEIAGSQRVASYAARRRELRKRFNNLDDDPEAIPEGSLFFGPPIMPEPDEPPRRALPPLSDWPLDREQAASRQRMMGDHERTIDLPGGIVLELVRIPAGTFVMGNQGGSPDERLEHHVTIERPFWMGRFEISNRQFAAFDPGHDSRVESRFGMQFGVRGFFVNGPDQPVVRVSWEQANAFCEWLSRETALPFKLPTEAQWEYACRAGTASPFYYGDDDTDFSPFANLADRTLSEFVCHPYMKERVPLPDRSKYDDWIPKDERFDDGGFLSDGMGNYVPNAWGLYDMHGNVAEWTRSAYAPYPHQEHDGRNDETWDADQRVVRGGSWRDRPARARSGARGAYRPYQGVFNVGFRVVCETE